MMASGVGCWPSTLFEQALFRGGVVITRAIAKLAMAKQARNAKREMWKCLCFTALSFRGKDRLSF